MDTQDRLDLIYRHIQRATEAVATPGVSPVLVAVVAEMKKKSDAARASGTPTREQIVELEEAGDCAKAGVLADPGASEEVRHLVCLAHDSLCMFKNNK